MKCIDILKLLQLDVLRKKKRKRDYEVDAWNALCFLIIAPLGSYMITVYHRKTAIKQVKRAQT